MEDIQVLDRAELPYVLELPARWQIDDTGQGQGVIIAADSQPWTLDFYPNVTVTHSKLGDQHEYTAEATLAAQQAVELTFESQMEDYRLIHLDQEIFGSAADNQRPVVGAMRTAYYTNQDALPLMLHQWVARNYGYEVSMTVTFAAADLPVWAEGSWALASALSWKEVTA